MGALAITQARCLALMARRSDIEYLQQQVSQKRIMLAMQEGNISTQETNDMASAGTDENTMNGLSEKYTAELAPVQALDKVLELQSQQYDTQHQSIQTELDACKKMLENDTGNKSTFAIFGANA